MRKSQGIEIHESIFTGDDSITTQTFDDEKVITTLIISLNKP